MPTSDLFLHRTPRRPQCSLNHDATGEFVIDDVGRSDDRQFQDFGIEYYRYVAAS